MIVSALITPSHLARKAIIYIRQSTPQQVLTNQESLQLQYALHQRALELGWPAEAIETIDTDLGQSATTTQHREGFKNLVAQVTQGHVGIILSYEVTRLSRNCSDWYPLLDLCGYTQCLIADRDGVYDPGSLNGRLLLGLKGQLSEMELHTIRARMTAGLLNKAERGELALPLPVGLVRDANDQVRKDPNQEIQARITLIFTTFLRLKSASKVLHFFNEQELLLPRRDRFGDVIWKKPRVAAILAVLKNPAYAGAFVYGRTRTTRDPLSGQVTQKRLPMAEWRICVKNKYPAYISWETFKRIQAMLEDNYAEYDRNKSRGVPRTGAALLQGLVYCGECGHKMVVEYKRAPRYICNYLRQQYGVSICQNIPAQPVDTRVIQAFFQALSPIELDAYTQALTAQQAVATQIAHARQQQLERLHYQTQLAERRFKRVDPDNRLVAAELERQWEAALAAFQQAQDAEAQYQTQPAPVTALPEELKSAFTALGQRLPQVWDQLSRQHQKAFLRCLIDKVVVQRTTRDCVHTRIVWHGGDVTTMDIPITVGAFADLAAAEEIEQIIIQRSSQNQSDEEIAAYLTRLGHRSSRHSNFLPSTVKTIRLKHRIFHKPHLSIPRSFPGYLTIPQIAEQLDITVHWIYHQIRSGRIQITKDPDVGMYLFPDATVTLEMFENLKNGKVPNLRF
ncbi:MAG: recombinase family protein [Anaerolineae bacterium]|jgi:DNA invertase Pin-like site-specific DNA recombinase|nr:recombinase family protein [Anaerolineae bacterium]